MLVLIYKILLFGASCLSGAGGRELRAVGSKGGSPGLGGAQAERPCRLRRVAAQNALRRAAALCACGGWLFLIMITIYLNF